MCSLCWPSLPVHYWSPLCTISWPSSSLLRIAIPLSFYTVQGFSRQEYWGGLPFPLQWTTFWQTSPPWPAHLGWPHMEWLSFIELDKAVMRLASCLWLWFQSVYPLMPSLSAYQLTWVLLTLDVRYLLSAMPRPWFSYICIFMLCCAVLRHPFMLFIDPESPESKQGICCSIHFQLAWRLGLGSSKCSVCSFEKTRDQIANICWIIKKAKEFPKNIYFFFIDYAKAFDCVDHNKLWKTLKEMGIPDHLICLLRNLYAGQEATVRTGHGIVYLFQIVNGVHQGCILSPCLFNLYAECLTRNTGLEEAWAGVKIAGRNINNFIYADDATLMAESEEELRSLLMKVKEESEEVGLNLNIQKTKIMAAGLITSWQIDGETVDTVADFSFLGSKITLVSDFSHGIKRHLLIGRKVMTAEAAY